MKENNARQHPLKYALWIACASIVMMFAGFSSAFIVKKSQTNWLSFDLPLVFWYSTAVIVLSSITLLLCRKAFHNRQMSQYKLLLAITTILGIAFVVMQYIGFTQLWNSGVTITRNVSFSFLYVIVGLHALHVVGGVIALMIRFFKSLNNKKRVYTSLPIDLINTYWHFVDLLWIYLLIFLLVIG